MAPHGLYKLVIFFTVAFIFSLTLLLPKSDELAGGSSSSSVNNNNNNNNKAVIGSRPPACLDKCMKCRPCMATVIVPSNHRKSKGLFFIKHDEDDSYYLLSWRCTCGNKIFHP